MQQPVFLTAQWRHRAMVNYTIDPDVLAPFLPAGVEIDFHAGKTFISLVGFLFLDTRVAGWAIPRHRNFEEVNLRFYVRREVNGEQRRGVVFIKEIVPRIAITAVARRFYKENYVTHPMRHNLYEAEGAATAKYEWKHQGRWNHLSVTGQGPPQFAAEGTQEQFITEHYWGYTKQSDERTLEYEVAHPTWKLWSNCTAQVDCDAALLYGPAFAEAMRQPPGSCLLADGSAISVHRGQPLRSLSS